MTAGHLSTCPRMLKAADALHHTGYQVRVVSTQTRGWPAAADAAIIASRGWQSRVVNYDRTDAPVAWLRSGARHKAARALMGTGTSLPRPILSTAFSRVHRELVDAVLEQPVDLIYGGTSGALAAIAEAGHRARTPFAIDFEDFHCGEHPSPEGDLTNNLARSVMCMAAEGAAFVTAGSAAIARACHDELGISALPIDNVFPLPHSTPAETTRSRDGREFAVYWFSQTISEGRGLEDVVRALALTRCPASLTVRGCPVPGYAQELRAMAAREAPRVRIVIETPIAPDAMVDACRAFDLGVSAEQLDVPNRALSLPNKALTYPLAGLPVALTNTAGHEPLARDLADAGLLFSPGQPESLAAQLLPLITDESRLSAARAASWRAARNRWHWEYESERGALLAAVKNLFS